MEIFEITIQHQLEVGLPVVAEHIRPGELPRRSESWLKLGETFTEELTSLQLDASGYGSFLGEALFQGAVRDSFMAARAEAESNQQPLRVLLVVEDPLLKPLRWERLCAPGNTGTWDFIALDQRTLYSLYLPSLTDRRFPVIGRRDLRALVVLASPPESNRYQLASFDTETMANSIASSLGEIPHALLGALQNGVGPATLDALCTEITAQHYTILHLVAHGQYLKDGETVLYLLDNEGEVAPVKATELIKRLGRLMGVRGLPYLTFLATCESAKPEAEAALGGLAQRLVRDLGMPAVVAMTERVSIATAELLARPFYTQLRQHGEIDRALVEAGSGMQGRADILVPALYSRLGGRPLFSDQRDGDRSLTNAEIQYGLERLDVLLPDRAPVLQDEFDGYAKTLRETLDTEPEALSKVSRDTREDTLDAINALSEEVMDLSFPALALDQPVPDYSPICPFPGLKAFQTVDQDYFFGREEKVKTLIKRLKEERFLAVLGTSGSGKSSLVLAGMAPELVPALKDLAEKHDQMHQYRYLTPGIHPETALARQLKQPISTGLVTLLVVDQFEELFTLCTDPEQRKRFLDTLLKLGNEHPDLQTVLTLRADFWGDCAPYPKLKEQMQAHQELLAPMTTQELRGAMEQQAASVGLRFEADLSHTILAEVEDEPGAMPLLQHLLLELWKRRHGRWLKAEEYRELGGIKQAIAGTADTIYGELKDDKEGQGLLRNLFVRLTRLDEKNEGEGQYRDTRQRVAFKDLVPVDADSNRVRKLVQRLADARLVVTTSGETPDETEVEVSHEALIRYWPRLRTWLDEDRESWILLAAIRQQAKDWHNNGEKKNDLPRWSERLQQTEVLFRQERFGQNELEHKFLAATKSLWASEKLQKKIWKSIGLAAIAIFFVVVMYFFDKAKETDLKVGHQLATRYVINAYDDIEGEPLRAAHYFAQASQTFFEVEDYKATASANIGLKTILNSFMLLEMVEDSELLTQGVNKILSLSNGKTLRVLDARSGRPITPPFNSETYVTGALFNADESRVITWDGETGQLWDSETGQPITQQFPLNDSHDSVTFNSDRSRVLTNSDNSVSLLDGRSGELIVQLLKYKNGSYEYIFSADGSRILTWGGEWEGQGTVQLLSSKTGQLLTPPIKHESMVIGAMFNGDESLILSWDVGGSVWVWDSKTGRQITLPLKHGKNYLIEGVVLNSDETLILSWGYNVNGDMQHTARLWDSKTGQPLTPPLSQKDYIKLATFNADGSRVLAWGGGLLMCGIVKRGSLSYHRLDTKGRLMV